VALVPGLDGVLGDLVGRHRLLARSARIGAQLVCAVALTAVAAAQDVPPDKICLMCHDDVHTNGGAGGQDSERIHADVACVDCHLALRDFDIEELEHEEELPPASCTPCHADTVRKLEESAHQREEVDCAVCHGTHDLRSFHGADEPVAAARINALCVSCHAGITAAAPGEVHFEALSGRTCLACHDAHAAAAPAPILADAVCLECHDGVESDGGAPAPSNVAGSVHGRSGIACVLCHAGLRDTEAYPHGPVNAVRCGACHLASAHAYRRGIHSTELDSGVAAGCADCHGTHEIQAVRDPRSTVFPLRLPDTCESCHRPEPPAAHPAPGGEQVAEYETSVHGRALRKSGLVVTATCRSCHGSHEIHPAGDPEASTSRGKVPYTCGACHVGVLNGYLAGVHGEAFLTGGQDVPVCTDCHSEHSIEDPSLARSSVSAGLVSATCARCHADDELARSYGLPSARLASFGRSYHGVASSLGESRAANCASCHGFHEIFPSTDPRSRIHAENLEKTCGGCHPGAGPAFARVPVHSVIDRETHFAVWFLRAAYLWVILATIGFFVLFIVVDLYARARLRLGLGPSAADPVDRELYPDEDRLVAPGETFARLSRQARLQHGVLIASFSLLVLTGLPLFLHDVPLMRSIVDFEGGYRLRGELHRVAAVALCAVFAWHIAATLLHPGGIRWLKSILLHPRDVIQLLQEFMFNLGFMDWLARRRPLRRFFERHPALAFRARPLYAQYGPVEKLEYAAVAWGTAVMVASGVVLWRPDWFLGFLPPWVFDVCRVVHGFEATLAFLAIIIWHMYHVHLQPGVFPMSRVFLTGRISRRELKHHHPLEYAAILARRRAQRGPPGAAPEE